MISAMSANQNVLSMKFPMVKCLRRIELNCCSEITTIYPGMRIEKLHPKAFEAKVFHDSYITILNLSSSLQTLPLNLVQSTYCVV